MNTCLQEVDVSEWIIKEETILRQKDPLKGSASNNYIPITCLPIMY